MTSSTSTATAVHTYLAAWNATDAAARRESIAAAFTPDVRYVDPLADVRGVAELDALVAGVQQRFPGMVFTLLGEPDAHHDVVRFTWGLGPDGAAEPPIVGFDVARLAADGRIAEVHGFLDRVPQH